MTSFRLSGGSTSDAQQRADGTGYQPAFQSLDMSANTAAASRYHSAVRYSGVDIPRGGLIRRAYLRVRWRQASQMTGADFTVRGHKIGNSPPLKTSAGATTGSTWPQATEDINSRIAHEGLTEATWDFKWPTTITSGQIANLDVSEVLKELTTRSDWNAGQAVTFILQGSATPVANYVTQAHSYDATNKSYWPELYVEWGNLTSNSFDTDLITGCDSLGVGSANAGHEIKNIYLKYPTWEQQLIESTHSGMVDEDFFFYSTGDQTSGYSPAGVVQDYIDTKSNGDAIVYRHEFAVGGRTIADFWSGLRKVPAEESDLTDPDPDNLYVYDSELSVGRGHGMWETPGGLNDTLRNPESLSRRALFWWLNGGNDAKIHAGNGNVNSRIAPKNEEGWAAFRELAVTREVDMFQHILHIWRYEADPPVDGYILIPNYPCMTVMSAGSYMSSPWKYPPTTSNMPFEHMVFSTPGFGFYTQTAYDGTDQQIRPGRPVDAATITGATNANPIVFTTASSHGLADGDLVTIAGVGGNTAANRTTATAVTVVDTTHFSIAVAGNGTYTSGGTMARMWATITGATNTNPIVYTTATPHGLVTDDTITVSGVLGNTAANLSTATAITYVDDTHFSVVKAGTGTYTSGGAIRGVFTKKLVEYIIGRQPDGARNQSATIALAACKQLQTYGRWDTGQLNEWNNLFNSEAGLTWAIQAPANFWVRTFGGRMGTLMTELTGSATVDGWKWAFCNINDINVNDIMLGEVEKIHLAVIEQIEAMDEEYVGRILYSTHFDAFPKDDAYSVDPTHRFAQWRRDETVKTDGIHPPLERTKGWVAAAVDYYWDKVGFLPGFVDPDPVTGEDDGFFF